VDDGELCEVAPLLKNFDNHRFGGFYLSFGYLIDPKNAVATSLAEEYVAVCVRSGFGEAAMILILLFPLDLVVLFSITTG
jgi:hypothetical protein